MREAQEAEGDDDFELALPDGDPSGKRAEYAMGELVDGHSRSEHE